MLEPTGQNAEQIRYWNEEAGPVWLAHRELLDAQIRPFGELAMDRAALRQGDRVIDVGCGFGETSLELARRVGVGGKVLGIDISTAMLEEARKGAAAAHLANAHFENVDAQTHPFQPAAFDLVYSRFGVMFFADPTAAFSNLRVALRPGGRVAFVCWQALQENQWAQVPLAVVLRHVPAPPAPPPDAPGPFAFADGERVRQILRAAGFTEITIEDVHAPMGVGGGINLTSAVEFLMNTGSTGRLLREAANERIRSRVRDELPAALLPFTKGNAVHLGAAVWIVTARSESNRTEIAKRSRALADDPLRGRQPTSHERMAGQPWDASYHDGPPPWDIGRPQPAIVRLASAGGLAGRVLDAGCGTGENTLLVASLGLSVLGIDVAETALAIAREKARNRGIEVEFAAADAFQLQRLGRRFQTVLDCGLFHAFDRDERARYVASLAAVTERDGTLYVLCFSDEGPDTGPHPISEEELRAAFKRSSGWNVATIEPDRIQTRFHGEHGAPAWLATIKRT